MQMASFMWHTHWRTRLVVCEERKGDMRGLCYVNDANKYLGDSFQNGCVRLRMRISVLCGGCVTEYFFFGGRLFVP